MNLASTANEPVSCLFVPVPAPSPVDALGVVRKTNQHILLAFKVFAICTCSLFLACVIMVRGPQMKTSLLANSVFFKTMCFI